MDSLAMDGWEGGIERKTASGSVVRIETHRNTFDNHFDWHLKLGGLIGNYRERFADAVRDAEAYAARHGGWA